MKSVTNEERLIKHLIPRIEKFVYKTVKDMLPPEAFYPPESMLKKSFVKRVLEAEKRIKAGKGKTYSYEEFKRKFLKGL